MIEIEAGMQIAFDGRVYAIQSICRDPDRTPKVHYQLADGSQHEAEGTLTYLGDATIELVATGVF